MVKVNNLEKQKSRLQSEIEVLIIDLERANGTARELQKRVDTLERTNIEIKARLEETIQLYETAQRDLRNKQAEIIRINNELDKTKDQRDTLARENKKLGGKTQFIAATLIDRRSGITSFNPYFFSHLHLIFQQQMTWARLRAPSLN